MPYALFAAHHGFGLCLDCMTVPWSHGDVRKMALEVAIQYNNLVGIPMTDDTTTIDL